MIDDQLDPVVPSGQRADRERRIAWRTASVIILLNSLLNGIAAIIALEAVQLAVLIPATVVDIFLAVNLAR